MLFKASAPGSLMILGEHAVLYGSSALVCAIDKRMTVSVEERQDQQIHLQSSLGLYQTTISELQLVAPFQFVLATLQHFQSDMQVGCNIVIESQFSDKVGFASSAAVTVACVKVLTQFLQIEMDDMALIRTARQIIRAVQGMGSGADVAACVLGGMVAFNADPFSAERLPYQHTLTAVYSGYKTPTTDVVQQVVARTALYPELMHAILHSIGHCATLGIAAARTKDWRQLGDVMSMQQGLMQALGVSNDLLNEIIVALNQHAILGAKISGSGLGDCVIALGHVSTWQFKQKEVCLIPVAMSEQGVMCEKV